MSIVFRIILASILVCPAAALAQEPKKAVASPALQAEFGSFIAGFRKALKANDSGAVAAMTKLPFMNDKTYSNAEKFRAKAYPVFFTAKTRGCFQNGKAFYDRDGENNDTYSITCSDNIFTFTRTPAGFLFTDVGPND